MLRGLFFKFNGIQSIEILSLKHVWSAYVHFSQAECITLELISLQVYWSDFGASLLSNCG